MSDCYKCKFKQSIPWTEKHISCLYYWEHKDEIIDSPSYDPDVNTTDRIKLWTNFPFEFIPQNHKNCKKFQI